MNRYLAQQADQALKELLTNAPLPERLRAAGACLNFANTPEARKESPTVVCKALDTFFSGPQAGSCDTFRELLITIFEEWGRAGSAGSRKS